MVPFGFMWLVALKGNKSNYLPDKKLAFIDGKTSGCNIFVAAKFHSKCLLQPQ
jgi:hypothetical protein